jgi:hypothetical protein
MDYKCCDGISVNFTNLNTTCPNNNFPLPKIYRLVDSMIGFEYLSFLYSNLGYHQIPMHPYDKEKTTFITNKEIFCYRSMPFGLKNSGTTYQRMVNKVFKCYLKNTRKHILIICWLRAWLLKNISKIYMKSFLSYT